MSRSIWKGPFNQNIDKDLSSKKKLDLGKYIDQKPYLLSLLFASFGEQERKEAKSKVNSKAKLVKQAKQNLPQNSEQTLPLRVSDQNPELLAFAGSALQEAAKQKQETIPLQSPSSFVKESLQSKRGSKGSFNHQSLQTNPLLSLENKKQVKFGGKKKVWSRSSMILPQYVGRSFFIYNGKTFLSMKISPKMLGHKFGEFASTRQKPIHKKKK